MPIFLKHVLKHTSEYLMFAAAIFLIIYMFSQTWFWALAITCAVLSIPAEILYLSYKDMKDERRRNYEDYLRRKRK